MNEPSGGVEVRAVLAVDVCQRAAMALRADAPLAEVLAVVAQAARDATGAARGSVWLPADDGLRCEATTDATGDDTPTPAGRRSVAAAGGFGDLLDCGRPVVVHHSELREAGGPAWPGGVTPDVAASAVVRVPTAGAGPGVVVVEWPEPPPARDEPVLLDVLDVVGSWAATAVELATLRDTAAASDRRRRYGEVAARAGRSAARARTAANLARQLDELLVVDGVRVVGVAVREKVLRRALLADGLSSAERDGWRSGRQPLPLGGGLLGVPVAVGSRLLGSLRVRVPQGMNAAAHELLEDVAAAVGDGFDRSRLMLAAELAGEEGAAVGDRSWLVRDAAVDAADLLGGVADLATSHRGAGTGGRVDAAEVAARLAGLAAEGRASILDALAASEWMPDPGQRLLPALRSLATLARRRGGLDVVLRVVGEPVWLPPATERLLYRAAFETVTTAWHRARGTMVRLDLVYDEGMVTLAVTDDGVGSGPRSRRRAYPRLRRLVSAAGGALRVDDVAGVPRGVCVEVAVPVGRPPLGRHL